MLKIFFFLEKIKNKNSVALRNEPPISCLKNHHVLIDDSKRECFWYLGFGLSAAVQHVVFIVCFGQGEVNLHILTILIYRSNTHTIHSHTNKCIPTGNR